MLLSCSFSFVRKMILTSHKPVLRYSPHDLARVFELVTSKASGKLQLTQKIQSFKSLFVSVPWRLPKGMLLGGALGFHKDGIRHVLFYPAQPEKPLIQSYCPPQGMFGMIAKVLDELIGCLRVLLRTLQMFILVTPLVFSFPLTMSSQGLKSYWFKMLITVIEICGPVYVKLGQWASTRRDIFSPEVCFHLSKLQQNVKTHPWEFTDQLLKKTFGEVFVSAAFTHIDQNPIGSGCCAQVYFGWLNVTSISLESRLRLKKTIEKRLKDGIQSSLSIPVAIKVLHPDISENFSRDLKVLNFVINFLAKIIPSLQWLSIKESIQEFGDLMNKQTNLICEAESLLQFNNDFKGNSNIVFPVPITELCQSSIIVETFEDGIPLTHITNNLEKIPMPSRKNVADIGVEMLLKMVFRNNFVHGDLHPGNILVRGLNNKFEIGDSGVQLVVLDPGIVATLTQKDLANFRSVFAAIVRRDGKKVGQLFLSQSHNLCRDPEKFIQQMDGIVSDALSQELSLSKLDVGNLLSRVFTSLRCHQVKLDPNFTSVILAIMVLEGLGRSLDPDIDLLLKATPFLIHMKV